MPHSAAAIALATSLVARFRDLCIIDQNSGNVLHAGLAVGAESEYFNANTGGWVWVSNTVHRAEDGTLVHVQAGVDSCSAYIAQANTAEECEPLIFDRCGETDDIMLAEGDYTFPNNSDQPAQLTALRAIYARWIEAEGLPSRSATDLHDLVRYDTRQLAWLEDFAAEWNERGFGDKPYWSA